MGPFIFILRLHFIHLKVLLNLTVMPLVISVTSVNCEGSPRLWSKRVTPPVVKCPGKVAVMCTPYWLLCDFRWPKADNVCWAVTPCTQGAGLWHSNLFSSYRQMALLRGTASMNMACVCESAKQCRSFSGVLDLRNWTLWQKRPGTGWHPALIVVMHWQLLGTKNTSGINED